MEAGIEEAGDLHASDPLDIQQQATLLRMDDPTRGRDSFRGSVCVVFIALSSDSICPVNRLPYNLAPLIWLLGQISVC